MKFMDIFLDFSDVSVQATKAPEVGNEGWKSVRRVAFSNRLHGQKGPCSEEVFLIFFSLLPFISQVCNSNKLLCPGFL